MKRVLTLLIMIITASTIVIASTDVMAPKKVKWQFDGMLGTFDRTSIQRGFQVYKEVCAACHSLKLISFRNLTEIGFSPEEAKAIAKEYSITAGPNDSGEMFERPGTLPDYFPGPYANDQVARASNNGALPPDLSLVARARSNGANYIYSLLTGFNQTPPEGISIQEGMYYNPYFSGMQIAMASPLSDGMVQYSDGTNANVDQMAKDVVNFLQWTSDNKMETRKSMGIKVLFFLAVFTGLFLVAKKRIWNKI